MLSMAMKIRSSHECAVHNVRCRAYAVWQVWSRQVGVGGGVGWWVCGGVGNAPGYTRRKRRTALIRQWRSVTRVGVGDQAAGKVCARRPADSATSKGRQGWGVVPEPAAPAAGTHARLSPLSPLPPGRDARRPPTAWLFWRHRDSSATRPARVVRTVAGQRRQSTRPSARWARL